MKIDNIRMSLYAIVCLSEIVLPSIADAQTLSARQACPNEIAAAIRAREDGPLWNEEAFIKLENEDFRNWVRSSSSIVSIDNSIQRFEERIRKRDFVNTTPAKLNLDLCYAKHVRALRGGAADSSGGNARNEDIRNTSRDQPARPAAPPAPSPSTDGPTTAQERKQLADQTKAQQYQKQAEYGRKTVNDPRKHKPEMMANHCLVKSPIGKSAPYNKCDFKIEVAMCMYRPNYKIYEHAFFELGGDFDCEKKQSGLWTVPAGGHVNGQWHGERLNWFVCRKPSSPYAEYSPTKKGMFGRCD